MTNIKERILWAYSGFIELFFYIFLFGTLSFGRAFSTICIKTPLATFFITEIFLLLSVPVLIYKYRTIGRLPRPFLALLSAFFAYALSYLLIGLFRQNMFALRDSVLFSYILFLPVVLIYLNNINKVKIFIAVIILANAVNLCVGGCFFMHKYMPAQLRGLLSQVKMTNLSLYYAIAGSFIISFYGYLRPKAYKLFALFILSLDIGMLILASKSSVWIATLLLLLFLFSILKKKFLSMLLLFIPVFMLTNAAVLYFNFKMAPSSYTANVASFYSELEGYSLFPFIAPYLDRSIKSSTSDTPAQKQPLEFTNEAGMNSMNMNWRLNIWKQTLQFCKDSPIIGKGFGVYPEYKIWYFDLGEWRPPDYPRGIYLDSKITPAHNHFLTVLFKMGILGLGLFLAINIYAFVYALLHIKKTRLKFTNNLLTALLGAFIFWHVLALFFDVIDSPPTSIFLWVIMGSIFSAVEIDKNS